MNYAPWIFTLATLLGVLGMWLMLPRGTGRGLPAGWAWRRRARQSERRFPILLNGRAAGAVFALAAAGLGLWALRMPLLGDWAADRALFIAGNGIFFVLAGVTVVAAVGTVTFRNPVYCAIWFGLTLLGTAGLFLLAGAQFLAVATVVVYAGAILVTFLFVLMLAQPRGWAVYDRASWEPLVSAALGVVIVGILSITVSRALLVRADSGKLTGASPAAAQLADGAGNRIDNVLAERHVAHLGAELFGRHLIAVEVAGTLLLAALVGAAIIVAHARAVREQ